MEYAGFWKRFVAYLIDVILLGVVGAIINQIFDQNVASLVTTLVGWGYFAGMESSARQATLGKSVMGMVVTDIAGNRISFLRATGRYVAKLLSAVILFIGYIMAAFTARKQALHDLLAGTLVLSR